MPWNASTYAMSDPWTTFLLIVVALSWRLELYVERRLTRALKDKIELMEADRG